ncbi:MAG: hypothetical protein J2P15_07490 [Micromonosporaceae bacterium]|nr:hypothetical protein [Micromonosporaceae bacterium]
MVTYDNAGTRITESIPPDDWRPTTASTAELEFFGIPGRPSTSTALSSWLDEWGNHYSGVSLGVPCAPTVSVSAATNSHWAGQVATAGGYTEAYGTTEYNPGDTCGVSPDGYTNWVGLGGWLSGRLLQNGFIYGHTFGSHPFFEAINGGQDTGADFITFSFPYGTGDHFNIATSYDPVTGVAHFGWHDIEAGRGGSVGMDVSVFATSGGIFPASNFYDSSTGEAIDERPEVISALGSPEFTTLRPFGHDTWTNATVSRNGGPRTAIRSEPHTGVEMYDGLGRKLVEESGSSSDLSLFQATWLNCGELDPA